jgi:ubiquinone/menaquinone biosynthesis C-methylase UbiE
MPTPKPYKNKPLNSTYYLQDRYIKAALTRLTNLEHMITIGLGGILSEHPDPTVFRRVLDIGSGSGSWVIDAAQAYPTMSLVGIDIDKRLIDYARGEAATFHVNDRVEFQTMDVQLQLAFPDSSFDLELPHGMGKQALTSKRKTEG